MCTIASVYILFVCLFIGQLAITPCSTYCLQEQDHNIITSIMAHSRTKHAALFMNLPHDRRLSGEWHFGIFEGCLSTQSHHQAWMDARIDG